MSKYLYGASVQAIQGFIFQTNKLREIAGASQLVDNICTSEFKDFCEKKLSHTIDNKNIIMAAAGAIKYFVDEETAKKIVRFFPKHVANYAPGITISQAVVEYDESDVKKSIDDLENKLKTQRNKSDMPVETGFMGLERARRTGGVGYEFDKDGVIDRGTYAKTKLPKEDSLNLFKKVSGLPKIKPEEVPFDLSEITKKEVNSWLAVIHADGNGLGQIISNLGKNVPNEKRKEVFKAFSIQLEEATKEATQQAFKKVVADNKNDKIYPVRPVVLGGDDLTVIIRADLAYDFTKEFLEAFENKTEQHFAGLKQYGVTRLTACAGIAYIKDSYPFHYGVDLAEKLTSKAKKFSKSDEVKGNEEIAPSSLAFYKVQSSFTESLDEMIKRTHTIDGESDLFYGPYLLHEINGHPSIKEMDILINKLENLGKEENRIAKIRQWLSELHNDKNKADFLMNRIEQVNSDFYENLKLEKYRNGKTILNDLIHLYTLKQIYNDKKQ